MNFIPTDLIFEIFSRLPEKSIARCCCVSKQWASMLHLPYFTELLLTKSLARPRLLFDVKDGGAYRFFSVLQPQHPYENSSSLVVAADFHMNFPRSNMWTRGSSDQTFPCAYASGLIYFPDTWISIERDKIVPVICNPNTGQYAILPQLPYIYWNPFNQKKPSSFLGFDPIGKEYKVLFIDYRYSYEGYDQIIHTLGSVKMMWSNIICPLVHEPLSEGVCIDGVLYYLACVIVLGNVIVCFDVRSEEFFKFINADLFSGWRTTHIVNYKGKLCVICFKYDGERIVHKDVVLRMWVLEDVEELAWSKHDYTLSDYKLVYHFLDTLVAGVTAMGEIVFSMKCRGSPFYVFYVNPEKNTFQSVKIRGFVGCNDDERSDRVYTFVDQVADLNVNYAELFKTSISAPSVKNKNGLNIINKGPKPQRQEKLRKGKKGR
ncbi:unnamed protein product [Microthlaspi erraticum]|uniref:F-box domain-containing protein n=1 Tax=Microthlaspi erraticum TaxID=1685480 RepID=A0A6D2I9X5_9BRAS|nr:unnamed protein product [Microthlaspi erraticum]